MTTSWYEAWRAAHWAPSQRVLDLPPRFQSPDFREIPEGPLRRTVDRYVRQFPALAPDGRGFAFFGRARSYKTYAAAFVCRWVYEQPTVGLSSWLYPCTEFAGLEARRFDAATEATLEALIAVPFLVLDDINAVRHGSHAADLFQHVVASRFNLCYPTAYTGNLLVTPQDPSPLAQYFGPIVGRRVWDACEGFKVVVT